MLGSVQQGEESRENTEVELQEVGEGNEKEELIELIKEDDNGELQPQEQEINGQKANEEELIRQKEEVDISTECK